jgi:hypothetical protein
MALRKHTLLKEYRGRLDDLRSELTRWPNDSDEAKRLRDLMAHYEQQIRDLEQPGNTEGRDKIGPGPTLGGDGKPVIDD